MFPRFDSEAASSSLFLASMYIDWRMSTQPTISSSASLSMYSSSSVERARGSSSVVMPDFVSYQNLFPSGSFHASQAPHTLSSVETSRVIAQSSSLRRLGSPKFCLGLFPSASVFWSITSSSFGLSSSGHSVVTSPVSALNQNTEPLLSLFSCHADPPDFFCMLLRRLRRFPALLPGRELD